MYALAAAMIAAWVTCPPRYLGLIRSISPRYLHLFWWMPSILIAMEYVAMVLVAAFSGAVAGYGPRLQLSNAEMRRNVLRATSVAIWMAPLMILLLERSALTGLIAAGMVMSAFMMLGIAAKDNSAREAYSALEPTEAWQIFHIPDARGFAKLAMAIIASGLLQAALLANLIAEREFALLLFVAGAALLAAQLPASEGITSRQQFLSSNRSRVLASTVMATVVVLLGLLPFLMSSARGDRSLDALLRGLLVKTAFVPVERRQSVRVQQSPIRSDGYIGVILTPKQEKHTDPKIPQFSLNARAAGFMRPMTIAFTGSYWFFQSPFLGPPLDSVIAEGDPERVGVRSSNYKPLLMEAVQDLDEPIETAGLDKIQLAMLDADPYPGTVSVELVVVDTHSEDHLQSLGVQRPNVIPMIENASSAHSETLTFLVPPQPRCKHFNQIRLIFRLDPSRSRQGAAIAIQSFMLDPEGM